MAEIFLYPFIYYVKTKLLLAYICALKMGTQTECINYQFPALFLSVIQWNEI